MKTTKTKKTKILTIVLASLATFALLPVATHAGTLAAHPAAATPEEAALQKRFKARYPQLQQFKKEGVIGETDAGFVDFVKAKDEKAAKIVDEENADRKTLYKLIADREGITIEVVAQRAAKRNFDHARQGEWLKEAGKWRQKEASPAPSR
jgi:uncharacterized protein YdbL (DUF1318 family)